MLYQYGKRSLTIYNLTERIESIHTKALRIISLPRIDNYNEAMIMAQIQTLGSSLCKNI
jgi:hypothetical protein